MSGLTPDKASLACSAISSWREYLATRLVASRWLAVHGSREVDHPAGDVDSVVGQTLPAQGRREIVGKTLAQPQDSGRPSWRSALTATVPPAQGRRHGGTFVRPARTAPRPARRGRPAGTHSPTRCRTSRTPSPGCPPPR